MLRRIFECSRSSIHRKGLWGSTQKCHGVSEVFLRPTLMTSFCPEKLTRSAFIWGAVTFSPVLIPSPWTNTVNNLSVWTSPGKETGPHPKISWASFLVLLSEVSGSNQHTFVVLQFWSSEVQSGFPWLKSQRWQGLHSFLVLRGESVCLFQLLKVSHIPWLFSILESAMAGPVFAHHISWHPLLPSFFHLQRPVWFQWTTWRIQISPHLEGSSLTP